MWYCGLITLYIFMPYCSLSTGAGTNAPKLYSIEEGFIPGPMMTNCTCGRVNRALKRIYGGTDSEQHEWPMMAAIIAKKWHKLTNVFICGGTIITKRHILTAAQCFYDENDLQYEEKEIGVVVGQHNLQLVNYSNPNELITPEDYRIHAEFDEVSKKFDIGIIILPNNLKFSKIILPICLPRRNINTQEKKLKITGWGYLTMEGPQSSVLQKATVYGMAHSDCEAIYTDYRGRPQFAESEPHQICTYKSGTAQCKGDAGGPVMWLDPKTNRYVQVGILSDGPNTCRLIADISTDVSYFIPWIQYVISDTYPEVKTCARRGKDKNE